MVSPASSFKMRARRPRSQGFCNLLRNDNIQQKYIYFFAYVLAALEIVFVGLAPLESGISVPCRIVCAIFAQYSFRLKRSKPAKSQKNSSILSNAFDNIDGCCVVCKAAKTYAEGVYLHATPRTSRFIRMSHKVSKSFLSATS